MPIEKLLGNRGSLLGCKNIIPLTTSYRRELEMRASFKGIRGVISGVYKGYIGTVGGYKRGIHVRTRILPTAF